ncbi:MAG: HNH endonuclease, partial [Lachnospiraceae bacterium]|nr:HNH endonuclease [Lachnospiraceae bacterium]
EEIGTATITDAGSDYSNGYHYYHQNEHGDIEYITGKDGKIENAYTYDAFGNITNSTELIKNRYTYNGEQYDKVTQQYYLRARYYNPLVGRFTQEDVYRGDGLNLYAYCGNNPVMYVDPSGYVGKKCGTGTGNAGGGGQKFTDGSNVQPKYSTLEQRYAIIPSIKGKNGFWTGKRGESMYVSSAPRVKHILNAYNQKGVNYKNGMPDFSPFTRHEFIINMSNDRNKNFAQANKLLAQKLNLETGKNWNASKVNKWMRDNNYTWHELNDCKTIQMIPSEINHPIFKHLGGVGEINIGLGGN